MFNNIPANLHAIKESKGQIDGGPAFSNTVFHLDVALKENGVGRSMGKVTRPFKCGDASEYDKWAHAAARLAAGPVPVLCDFEMVAVKDGEKLQLIAIRPAPAAQVPKAA